MDIKTNIATRRSVYIKKTGRVPNGMIIGMEPLLELRKESPGRYLEMGGEYCGMKIILDKSKPSRIEIGEFEF